MVPCPLPLAAAALALLFVFTRSASAGEILLTDPAYGKINASALDQPRMYILASDPAVGGSIITWDNPDGAADEPVLMTAFVDTGASGIAISHLNATGLYDQPNLSFDAADYLGAFTETGIGGAEVGDVTRPFGILVRSGGLATSGEILPSEFEVYGDFNFWVRREVGTGEYNEFLGADPINLIGMPIIRQRRLYLDPRPMGNLEGLESYFLAPTATEIVTHATIPLTLHDFIGDTPPAGEMLPSHYANPLVPELTIKEGSLTTTGTWLLDTGAGSSFLSFAAAKAVGLIPANYATLAEFMADYEGPTADIGGIGSSQVVPILSLDRLRVTAREGAVLVWENVDVLIADVAGLDGIFGMNLLVPAVTVDPADPFGSLSDISPAPFTGVVIDTTDATDPVMRIATIHASGTVYDWLGSTFSAEERSNPAVGSLTADPDGDGFANLLEYALGLDPRNANSASAPAGGKVAISGDEFLSLSFSRPVGGRAGVNYFVEVSDDLQSWRRSTGEVTLHSAITSGERETLVYRSTAALAAGARKFLRLAIEPTP